MEDQKSMINPDLSRASNTISNQVGVGTCYSTDLSLGRLINDLSTRIYSSSELGITLSPPSGYDERRPSFIKVWAGKLELPFVLEEE